jgi:hypothetical protein
MSTRKTYNALIMNDIQNGPKTGQKTGPHALKLSQKGLKNGPFCPLPSQKWPLGGVFVPSAFWGFYANYANNGPGLAENPKAFLHATPGRRAGLSNNELRGGRNRPARAFKYQAAAVVAGGCRPGLSNSILRGDK